MKIITSIELIIINLLFIAFIVLHDGTIHINVGVILMFSRKKKNRKGIMYDKQTR